MTVAQDESIAIRPQWIRGIESKMVLPEGVSDRCQRHRSTRMP